MPTGAPFSRPRRTRVRASRARHSAIRHPAHRGSRELNFEGTDNMYQASTEQYRKTVAAVVTAARRRKSERGMDSKRFLEAYYANVDANDMAARAPAMLAGAALSHLKFAQRRRGRALVRVFHPTLKEHGYTSPHTVIEMVNDDMPFLVDSIGLAVSQRSLTIPFLAHPIFSVARDAAGVLRSIEERSPA